MRFGIVSLLVAVMVARGVRAASAGNTNTLACEMPAALLTPAKPLPHTAAALTRNRLSILALGSGSTVGDTASAAAAAGHAADAAFPYRLATVLRALRPAARIDLTVEGSRDITAEDMLPLLRGTLARTPIDLVLWQTGTVEAMRGSRPDRLRTALQSGAAAVRAADADLVLIDPQFSRFLRANADLTPYEATLRSVAGQQALPLFPRYRLTEAWAKGGEVDLERAPRSARAHTINVLNACLGEALAHFIVSGVAAR